MFAVSYLLWYSQWRVFLCYNRRWLGLASMWPRYSCSDHLYLVNGLTVKNSAKYSAFVSNFDGNCIVYWIAVHSSELSKIQCIVVLKAVHCSLHCSCMIWLHMKHCSIGKVHAPKAQEHEYVLQRSSNTYIVVLLVRWVYSSIRVSHAGRRSACCVRSDETDWKTQLPPHRTSSHSFPSLHSLHAWGWITVKSLYYYIVVSHQSTFCQALGLMGSKNWS